MTYSFDLVIVVTLRPEFHEPRLGGVYSMFTEAKNFAIDAEY